MNAASDSPAKSAPTPAQRLAQWLTARGEHVDRIIETHISWVVLAGEHAWKLKKPVQLGFLDFSTPRLRRRACEDELELNRRLAPSIYQAVEPLPDDMHDEPVLRMHRFPDGALLAERLKAGALQARDIDRFAQWLSGFHQTAPSSPPDASWGQPEDVQHTVLKVADGLLQAGCDTAAVRGLRDWIVAEGQARASDLLRRRTQGRVREVHGDLHLSNIVVLDDEVLAFDCIEFDPALRWIDVACDLAFAVMDLAANGRADLAWRLLDGWLTYTGDHDAMAVMRYYLVYRALVRALVAALRGSSPEAYLEIALAFAQPGPPFLAITCGLSGSGKSHLALALLQHAGLVRLRSDVERKRLTGLKPLEKSAATLGRSIYDANTTQHTYATLAERAHSVLAAGWPVVVDAAFLREAERRTFAQLAARRGVGFVILDCNTPSTLLRQRLRARNATGEDPSEADESVLELQATAREPYSSDEKSAVFAVDMSKGPTPALLDAILARFRRVRL